MGHCCGGTLAFDRISCKRHSALSISEFSGILWFNLSDGPG